MFLIKIKSQLLLNRKETGQDREAKSNLDLAIQSKKGKLDLCFISRSRLGDILVKVVVKTRNFERISSVDPQQK